MPEYFMSFAVNRPMGGPIGACKVDALNDNDAVCEARKHNCYPEGDNVSVAIWECESIGGCGDMRLNHFYKPDEMLAMGYQTMDKFDPLLQAMAFLEADRYDVPEGHVGP